MELENQGRTTNVYSGGDAGSYSEYGLSNAERVRGQNPTTLEEGQQIEVTVVIQQEEEGLIDHTVDTIEPVAERAQDTAASIGGIDTGESDGLRSTGGSSTSSSTANSIDYGDSVSSNRGGYLSSSSTIETITSNSSEPSPEDSSFTPENPHPNRGLVA